MSLNKIQCELKAPKTQNNNFGGYTYRSCEDILEALKPLLEKYEATLTISDEMVLIGERYYIKATATLSDKNGSVSVSAYAREPLNKKGMDEAQITGATSSYARKYALNGLFAIDDEKDADATNTHDNDDSAKNNKQNKQNNIQHINNEQLNDLSQLFEILGTLGDDCYSSFLNAYKLQNLRDLPANKYEVVRKQLNSKIANIQKGLKNAS